jgi:hypothetical protein
MPVEGKERPKRFNSYTLLMKEVFDKEDALPGEHKSQRRKRKLEELEDTWATLSEEEKQQKTAEAKRQNRLAKIGKTVMEEDRKTNASAITDKERRLGNSHALIMDTLHTMMPNALQRDFTSEPSSLLPVMAAEAACRAIQDVPIDSIDSLTDPLSLVPFNVQPLDSLQQDSNLGEIMSKETADRILQSMTSSSPSFGRGSFGLGDAEHGLSLALTTKADEQKSFVAKASLGFVKEHGALIEAAPNFDPDLTAVPLTCGSVCKQQIYAPGRFALATELQRNIVRFVRDTRQGKHGSHACLTPDTQYPLLLLAMSPELGPPLVRHKAFCMLRCCYSPLEADWFEVDVVPNSTNGLGEEELDLGRAFSAKMVCKYPAACLRLFPSSMDGDEFSLWYSRQQGNWRYKLVQYKVIRDQHGRILLRVEDPGVYNWQDLTSQVVDGAVQGVGDEQGMDDEVGGDEDTSSVDAAAAKLINSFLDAVGPDTPAGKANATKNANKPATKVTGPWLPDDLAAFRIGVGHKAQTRRWLSSPNDSARVCFRLLL